MASSKLQSFLVDGEEEIRSMGRKSYLTASSYDLSYQATQDKMNLAQHKYGLDGSIAAVAAAKYDSTARILPNRPQDVYDSPMLPATVRPLGNGRPAPPSRDFTYGSQTSHAQDDRYMRAQKHVSDAQFQYRVPALSRAVTSERFNPLARHLPDRPQDVYGSHMLGSATMKPTHDLGRAVPPSRDNTVAHSAMGIEDQSFMSNQKRTSNDQAGYVLDGSIQALHNYNSAARVLPNRQQDVFGSPVLPGTMEPTHNYGKVVPSVEDRQMATFGGRIQPGTMGRASQRTFDDNTFSSVTSPLYDRTYLQAKEKQDTGAFQLSIDNTAKAVAHQQANAYRGLPRVPGDLDRSIFSTFFQSSTPAGPGLPGEAGARNDSELVRLNVSSEKESAVRVYEKVQGLAWDPRELGLYDKPVKYFYEVYAPQTIKQTGVNLKTVLPNYIDFVTPPVNYGFSEPSFVLHFPRDSRRTALKNHLPGADSKILGKFAGGLE